MKHPLAEIFSQGEEVINGQIADTNAAWLSQQLVEMGFVIARHTAVGDKLEDLISLLKEISQRADFCICTGGLGPTVDDLTAEAVAQAFDKPLQLDTIALVQIERHFSNRNKQMADSNRKQAYFPKGAVRLDNTVGTAPGFALQVQRCWFVFVPGVPSEMRHIFNELIINELHKRYTLQADKLITIKTIGIGESDLQQRLNDCCLPKHVQLGFRAATEEVQTKLLFPAEMTDSQINNCVNQVTEMIGDKVFAIEQPNQPASNLVSVIGQIMKQRVLSLSIQETFSQGLISAKCIGEDWLHESNYQQSIDKVIEQLGINRQDDFKKAAAAIASQLKQRTQTDLVLVQLFEADKNMIDKTEDKRNNVILYNALQTPTGMYQETLTVSGSIKRKQNQAAIRALDFLRRVLQINATNTIK